MTGSLNSGLFMDCNKEEAIRAKEIGEKLMESNEFWGARNLVLKAQQLCPDLADISQMIMVCDVHCFAKSKSYGNGKDWYGILKVEPTADDTLIRKQYRKFALLLHPDKNKFAGASDAFKLISEAQKFLLDHEKRMLYDKNYKILANYGVQNCVYQQSVRHPSVQNNVGSSSCSNFVNQRQPQKTAQFGFFNRPTSCAVCSICGIQYKFYKDVMNICLFCPNCNGSFTGFEVKSPSATKRTECSQSVSLQGQKAVHANLGVKRVQIEKPTKYSSSKTVFMAGTDGKSKANSDVKNNGESQSYEFNLHRKINLERKGKIEESRQSFHSGRQYNADGTIIDEALNHLDACAGDNFTRRSSRLKKQVSYNENSSDDDDDERTNPSKCARFIAPSSISQNEVRDELSREKTCNMNKPDGPVGDMERDGQMENRGRLQNETKEAEVASEIGATTKAYDKTSEISNSVSNKSSDNVKQTENFEYPNPDFNDFDKARKEYVFALGQIWACYDPLDTMPRYYARIDTVFSPGFRLLITWLEPDPVDEEEIKWVGEGLPVACGKFSEGNSDNTNDHLMFSHLISWEKGKGRCTYMIFPRKGEIWTMFKNWDIKWYSISDGKRNFEFEFVEVLSDYAEGVGVYVGYLSKIRGFTCLFGQRMEDGIGCVLIPVKELFRFSHKVPSFRMTGKERKDVPEGSFELDPASLPTNLENIG